MTPIWSIVGPLLICTVSAAQWAPEPSVTKARLRGLAVVSDKVVWASGTSGTFVRTDDGGSTWKAGQVAGAEGLG